VTLTETRREKDWVDRQKERGRTEMGRKVVRGKTGGNRGRLESVMVEIEKRDDQEDRYEDGDGRRDDRERE